VVLGLLIAIKGCSRPGRQFLPVSTDNYRQNFTAVLGVISVDSKPARRATERILPAVTIIGSWQERIKKKFGQVVQVV
jgi:hypothetical protein